MSEGPLRDLTRSGAAESRPGAEPARVVTRFRAGPGRAGPGRASEDPNRPVPCGAIPMPSCGPGTAGSVAGPERGVKFRGRIARSVEQPEARPAVTPPPPPLTRRAYGGRASGQSESAIRAVSDPSPGSLRSESRQSPSPSSLRSESVQSPIRVPAVSDPSPGSLRSESADLARRGRGWGWGPQALEHSWPPSLFIRFCQQGFFQQGLSASGAA